MALPSLAVERRAVRVTQVAINRLCKNLTPIGQSLRRNEKKVAEMLFNLWQYDTLVNGKVAPSWVARGFNSFDQLTTSLGFSSEFARKAVSVWANFYGPGAVFEKWDRRLENTVQKMYQVSRIANHRDVDEWLRISHSATVEELERIVRRALREKMGEDSTYTTVVERLVGDEVQRWLNFQKFMEENFGPVRRRAVHMMTAIDEYMANHARRRVRRVA